MRASDLETYLNRARQSGVMDPFWLISGNDDFLAVETTDQIRQCARELGYLDRQVLDMNGRTDWSMLTMAAADIGIFDDKKILEVRIPNGKPGTQGAKVLAAYVEKPTEGVVTLFTMPAPDWAGQKAVWWKTLQQKSTVVDCDTIERAQLPAWLKARLARHRQTASAATLDFFADLTEGNLFAAAQEVEKLSLLYPEGELTEAMIKESVANSSRFDFDTLFESIHAGNAERAARIIDGLEAQSEALPFLLSMLTMDIRYLLKLRSGFDRGMNRVQGVFSTPSMTRAARRLSVKKLANALVVCSWIDRLAKGLPVENRDSDPWLELKSLVIFLAR